ncbi:hypothetical protein DdX_08206 [Ditylenchus destructor]|uniref:Uncharacterized protein n=1 Tax=Ditylenchus destructor TaxID=166010 RepID=A0AAD4N1S9_9BILA|nr:hypothetical protein DdX_08206 [Ditylenchus destructor]
MFLLLICFSLLITSISTTIDNWKDLRATASYRKSTDYDKAVASFHTLTNDIPKCSFPEDDHVLYVWPNEKVSAKSEKTVVIISEEDFILALHTAIRKQFGKYIFDLSEVFKKLVQKHKLPNEVFAVISKIAETKHEPNVQISPLKGIEASQKGLILYTFLGRQVLERIKLVDKEFDEIQNADYPQRNQEPSKYEFVSFQELIDIGSGNALWLEELKKDDDTC